MSIFTRYFLFLLFCLDITQILFLLNFLFFSIPSKVYVICSKSRRNRRLRKKNEILEFIASLGEKEDLEKNRKYIENIEDLEKKLTGLN